MSDDLQETIQIEFGNGISCNECVMAIYVTTTNQDGTLRRMDNGDIMPFDFIWNDVLEMETDEPEDPGSSVRQGMMRRFEELKLEHPEKTAPQVLTQFRRASEGLHNIIREYNFKEAN